MAKQLERIYPFYLVIDCSGSMDEPLNPFDKTRRIERAAGFAEAIFELYEDNQELISPLRISLVIFNRETEVKLKLAPVSNLRDLDTSWQPTSKTYFAQLFRALKAEIERDFSRYSTEYDMHNPAVVVVTDGIPSDSVELGENKETRASAWQSLTSITLFNQPVQVMMLGIGMAPKSILSRYATDPKLAWRPSDEDVSSQMKKLILLLKETVRKSLFETEKDGGWLQPEALDDIEISPGEVDY